MHAGLTARRRPEDVAADILTLGLDRPLTARARLDLANLAGQAVPTYMPTSYQQHPGLGRALHAATVAMDAVARAGHLALPAAPTGGRDHVAMLAWCGQGLTLLGLDPAPDALSGADAHEHKAAPRLVVLGSQVLL